MAVTYFLVSIMEVMNLLFQIVHEWHNLSAHFSGANVFWVSLFDMYIIDKVTNDAIARQVDLVELSWQQVA